MKRHRNTKIDRRLGGTIGHLLALSLLLTIALLVQDSMAGEQSETNNRTIVFTSIFPANMRDFSQMSEIYTEAFGRMGYRFRLISQPGERAMIDVNQGVVDGEAARIIDIEMNQYPNLIMVPEAILTMQDGAYAIDDSIQVSGWESLRGTPYIFGLMKGIKSIEQKLPLYVKSSQIVRLDTVEQALEMLKAKRIDLYLVGTQIEDLPVMKKDDHIEIKRVGVVETKSLYPWLHKRNKELAQPLAETLKALKAEGVYDLW